MSWQSRGWASSSSGWRQGWQGWQEPQSWHGWPGREAGSAAGGSAPRDTSAVDIEHVVYSTWPVHKSGYPSEGPLSFKQLTADAYDMGCKLSLRSHGGTRRTYRPNVLTVKGPTCWEVYKLCLVVAKQLNLDLSRVPPLQLVHTNRHTPNPLQ